MTDISALIERVKAATGPDRDIDRDIAVQLDGWTFERRKPNDNKEYWRKPGADWYQRERLGPLAYTASIDAALGLVNRLLPDWVVSDLSQNSRHAGDPWGCELALYFGSEPSKNRSAFSGWDFPTAPLAILTAALLALKDN